MTYNNFYNILRLFDVLPTFLSPQLKRSAIITYKHGIYELPHELPTDLRLRKYHENLKTSQNDSLVSSLPAKMKILSILEKTSGKQKLNFARSALIHMKTRVSRKHFVNDCLWKQFFTFSSSQTPSNLISLTILLTLRPFSQF